MFAGVTPVSETQEMACKMERTFDRICRAPPLTRLSDALAYETERLLGSQDRDGDGEGDR